MPLDPIRALTWRYYAVMLSAAAVAAGLGIVSAFTAGSASFLPELLAGTAVLLLGLNFLGALFLFAPIRHHLAAAPVLRDRLQARVRELPALSGLWVFALTAAGMAVHAGAVFGSWEMLAGSAREELARTFVQCAVFAGYLGLYTFLMVADYAVALRRALWHRGVVIPLRPGRFMARLVGALAAVVLGPVLLLLADGVLQSGAARSAMSLDMAMESPPGMSTGMQIHGHANQQYMDQTLHMDVFAALILSGLVIFLLTRDLSRSAESLLAAMGQIDRGDFRTRAPVVSDDEFGRLTGRFNQMLDGLDERDRLRRTFERFVPESVAAALIADEGAIAPQEREATVLFTDIERFTQIASTLSPREVVTMLNAYFGEVAAIVHRNGGVIAQFQGDAVLATFNLPVIDAEHAAHALQAALEIQQRLGNVTFNGGTRLRTRIGVSTGLVVGGTVGGGERLGYTVHGDTVNLAARLEALNKDLGTTILLSERTTRLLPSQTALRDCGEVSVRGFGAPLRVFEPLAECSAEAVEIRA